MGCLNVKVIKATSLGSSVGSTVSSLVEYYLHMIFKPLIPSKYWSIISPSIVAFIYSVSIYLAVFSGTIIQAYQAALKGSSLISKNLYGYASKNLKFLPTQAVKTICDASIMGLVLYALDFQAMNILRGNDDVNLILSPLTMVENFLVSHNNVK